MTEPRKHKITEVLPDSIANRIAKGKFTLDGVEYTLPVNNGPNHLHGGPQGFQNQIWDSRIVDDAVEFMYFSPDGEAGYPGNLKVVAHCGLQQAFTSISHLLLSGIFSRISNLLLRS